MIKKTKYYCKNVIILNNNNISFKINLVFIFFIYYIDRKLKYSIRS